MIVQGHEITQTLARKAHTVIVGSGSGGAVVAHGLATAGVEVVVLEEGGYFTKKDFTQREDQMFPALYRAGAQQMSDDGLINVLQGSCFGGSTVINTADCVPIPPEVFEHWKGLVGITELDAARVEDSVKRVFDMLRVNRISRDRVNANNAIMLDAGPKFGMKSGTFDNNRVDCVGSGYCLIGCAYDAKKGANLTYLPAAIAAGATVYTDCRVDRIERLDSGRLVVHGDVVERGPRVARHPVRIEAERVVLSAGTIHSPAILHRSGFDKGLPQLGRNLSLQPQMPVIAEFGDDRKIEMWRGIPQAAWCNEVDNTAERGLGGYAVEGINGQVGNSAAALPGFGVEHKALMGRLGHVAVALVLVPDRPSGEVAWEWRGSRGFAPKIHYRMRPEWVARMKRGLSRAAEIFFEAGAKRVSFSNEIFTPLTGPDQLRRIEGFPIRTGVARFVSAHPQGTCRMGLDARTSVVDQDHRLHTIPNLYVVDASVMPTTSSTHTMIPTMTLADRAAHRMLGSHAGS